MCFPNYQRSWDGGAAQLPSTLLKTEMKKEIIYVDDGEGMTLMNSITNILRNGRNRRRDTQRQRRNFEKAVL